jgi:hypothetical protein
VQDLSPHSKSALGWKNRQQLGDAPERDEGGQWDLTREWNTGYGRDITPTEQQAGGASGFFDRETIKLEFI